MTIVYFVIALGLLVFIHEFGHFIAAKKQGIGVEKFSIGFGPKLFSYQGKETTYMVSLLPFGGYVKLRGEDPAEENATTDKSSYSARPIGHRFGVVFAGPFMNLLLALFLMPIVFMIGRTEPAFLSQKPVVIGVKSDSPAEMAGLSKGDEILEIANHPTSTWEDLIHFVMIHGKEEVALKVKRGESVLPMKLTLSEQAELHTGSMGIEPTYFIGNEAIIDEVAPGSVAAAAGLMAGDEVVRINDSPIQGWIEMTERVDAAKGKSLMVTVRRRAEIQTVLLTPRYDEGLKRWLMGIRKNSDKKTDAFVVKKYPLGEAVVRGAKENLKLTDLTFSVLGRLVTLKLSYKTLGGPIRIAQASAMAAKSGLADFIYFLSFLSLQLGLLNFLPIPALDGGHLLFFGIEKITRRPTSMRLRQTIEQIGFFLLISLMLAVTLNDVNSVWGFAHLLEKIKHIF
ncbi:MAG: RIP metalloprotease RseP [Deltaproteobacteria bacterium]|nr:RIP metalloprotease RseP [Deltaproteobacteria bacterium]